MRIPRSHWRTAAVGAFFLLSAILFVQAQQDTSLGDVARRTRSQKPAADSTNKAQQLVDQMQQEEEASENAPPGFKSYNAGDYRLWVPFPYELEGRDNNGTVLAGSRLGVTNTEVMVGNPQPLPPNLNDRDFFSFIRQLALRYSQAAACTPMKVGQRRGYHCALGESLFDDS